MASGNSTTFMSETRPPRTICYRTTTIAGTDQETLTVDIEPRYTGTPNWARIDCRVNDPAGRGEYEWKTPILQGNVKSTNGTFGSVDAALTSHAIRGDLKQDARLDVSEALGFYHTGRTTR